MKYWRVLLKKIPTINPGHTNYLSYATATSILALQIAYEFGLVINLGLMRTLIQYGGGPSSSSYS